MSRTFSRNARFHSQSRDRPAAVTRLCNAFKDLWRTFSMFWRGNCPAENKLKMNDFTLKSPISQLVQFFVYFLAGNKVNQ